MKLFFLLLPPPLFLLVFALAILAAGRGAVAAEEAGLPAQLARAQADRNRDAEREITLRLLRAKPNDPVLLRTLARVQLAGGESGRCAGTLARLEVALGRPDADLLEMRGDLARGTVDSAAMGRATAAWEAALVLEPGRVSVLEKLAVAHRRSAAAALYLVRLAALRDEPGDLAGLARAAVRGRDWNAVMRYSARLREEFANRDEAKAWNPVYDRLMARSAALAVLDVRLAAVPDAIDALLARAWLFDAVGLGALADDDARHALKLRPGSLALKYQHAVIMAHAGEAGQAWEDYGIHVSRYSGKRRTPPDGFFARLLEIEGSLAKGADAAALAERSKLLFGEGQPDLALADASAAAALDPALAEAHLMLARIYHGADKAGAAKEAYARVLEIDPHHLDALAELGRLQRQLGDFAAAAATFARHIALDPMRRMEVARASCLKSLQKTKS